jgi:hypothetical protein
MHCISIFVISLNFDRIQCQPSWFRMVFIA